MEGKINKPFKKLCCVPFCSDKTSAQHRFPKREPELFDSWLKNINNAKLHGMPSEQIYRNFRVCDRHFSEDCKVPGKRGLKRKAVPTLFITANEKTLESVTAGEISHSEADPAKKSRIVNMKAIFGETSRSECIPMVAEGIGEDDAVHERTSERQVVKSPKASTSTSILKQINFTRQTQLSPLKKILYRRVVQSANKLNRLSRRILDYKKKCDIANKFAEQRSFQDLAKHLNPSAYTFILSQMRTQHLKPRGRRFTLDEKILCLTIMKASGKGYRLLRKIFALPSRRTLTNLLNRIPFGTGINKGLFNSLQKSVKTMKGKDNLCILLFDEMYISSYIHYNAGQDILEGLEDFGSERSPQLADHVNVFMLKGVYRQWKQPILFTFSSGPTKSLRLKNLIKDCILECQKIGLKIIATVCDQGSNNCAAINMLQKETKEDCIRNNTVKKFGFSINGHEIIPLYDVPHLFKGIRNNLLTKDLHFTQDGKKKIGKWEHIEKFYFLDSMEQFKICPKLTDEHVIRGKIKKMKVKMCTQVFSYQVGSLMKRIIDWNAKIDLPPSAADTADLILFLDQLFDSLNSCQKTAPASKPLKGALTHNSEHENYWKNQLSVLKGMTFFNSKKQILQSVPSLRNLIHSINGFIQLKKIYLNNRDYFVLRSFQQDSLENFFGAVRSYAYREVSPSVQHVVPAFKALIINNFMSKHSPNSNCEPDESDGALTDLKEFLMGGASPENSSSTELCPLTIPASVALHRKSQVGRNIVTYIAGFIARKMLKNVSCLCCRNYILYRSHEQDTDFVKARQYVHSKLTKPGTFFTFLVSESLSRLFYLIPRLCHKKNISKILQKTLLEQLSFNLINCQKHTNNDSLLVKLIIKCCLHFWCKKVNNISRGNDIKFSKLIKTNKDSTFVDPIMKAAHLKFCSRKKRFQRRRH